MKRTDCEVLFDCGKNIFEDLGNCLDGTFDDKKTKMNVLGNIYSLGKSLTKFTFNAGYSAVKNAPKAVVAVASAKRGLMTVIDDEINEHNKQLKESALDKKIKQLGFKVQ